MLSLKTRVKKLEEMSATVKKDLVEFDIKQSELFESLSTLSTLDDYSDLTNKLAFCGEEERYALRRYLGRTDLFYFLWSILNRKDVFHPWLLARCKEVQTAPDGYLDLWAREHYKSTIITFAKSIQDILASHGENALYEREVTIGIFSCTRPLAKGFLRQIKRELEANENLRSLFPDVIWENPHRDAPKWSEDDGLVLKRKSNPKESTIEAWGLVDGQPTGKHFYICVYDDVVTIDSVRSPHMIAKVTEAWELSLNLGTEGGKRRHIGTRYHFNDTYRVLLSRGSAQVRLYTPYDDGTLDGAPVLKSLEELTHKRRDQGAYTFACQMMQNPAQDEKAGFSTAWLKYHKSKTKDGLNIYVLVDPASEKKKTSDFTCMLVIGLGADNNYYVLDIIRDRMNLRERADAVFDLHRRWKPLRIGYEKYGMQADIEYIKEQQGRINYNFQIVPLGGQIAKNDRIRRLMPVFEAGRMLLPETCFKTNYQRITQDLVNNFIEEEYKAFPVPVHDDMFDCMARILDEEMYVQWPNQAQFDVKDFFRKQGTWG